MTACSAVIDDEVEDEDEGEKLVGDDDELAVLAVVVVVTGTLLAILDVTRLSRIKSSEFEPFRRTDAADLFLLLLD